jgi:hypothetical protein
VSEDGEQRPTGEVQGRVVGHFTPCVRRSADQP